MHIMNDYLNGFVHRGNTHKLLARVVAEYSGPEPPKGLLPVYSTHHRDPITTVTPVNVDAIEEFLATMADGLLEPLIDKKKKKKNENGKGNGKYGSLSKA